MTIQTTAPRQAAAYILAGMATLGLSDNLVPLITPTSSLWQFHLVRGVLVLAMLGLAAAMGMGALWPRRPLAVLGRSLFQAGAMLIYFGCLAFLPIGVVVAGLFTAPLFVLLIALIFQGKRVGPVRWSAIILGFVGAMLVIRPNPAALDLVAFLPIFAGFLYAVGAVATRAWCEGEDTLTLSAWFFGLLTLFGAIGCLVLPEGGTGAAGFISRGWMPLGAEALIWFPLLAIGAMIGIVCIFRGYQLGEASYVAVFEYSLLVFASVWALVLWDQGLPALALLGMAMIAGAGGVIALRSDQT